jgi:hypothetical protein
MRHWGPKRAAQHVPPFAQRIVAQVRLCGESCTVLRAKWVGTWLLQDWPAAPAALRLLPGQARLGSRLVLALC